MLGRLLRELAPYTPTVVGTYPLGLQVDGSDLDIACTCDDLDAFERALRETLSTIAAGDARIERLALGTEAVTANLELDGLPIEIFCQRLPVHEQAGFCHLVIEGRLLAIGGAALADRVRELKRAGTKTEPAFARILGLDGDPYAALLALEGWPASRLGGLVHAALRPGPPPEISIHAEPRAELLPLFRLADDSEQAIAEYLPRGTVLVATERGERVGHVQMIRDDAPATWELKSLAVAEPHRSRGLGRRLVEAGLEHARREGARRVVVSTAAADAGILRFYQRLGFRMMRIDRDVFTPEAGYPPDIYIDGVRLLDRAWLEITW